MYTGYDLYSFEKYSMLLKCNVPALGEIEK